MTAGSAASATVRRRLLPMTIFAKRANHCAISQRTLSRKACLRLSTTLLHRRHIIVFRFRLVAALCCTSANVILPRSPLPGASIRRTGMLAPICPRTFGWATIPSTWALRELRRMQKPAARWRTGRAFSAWAFCAQTLTTWVRLLQAASLQAKLPSAEQQR